jgi:multidrug efflux pump subunit AcrA (membrane-fusion protein)
MMRNDHILDLADCTTFRQALLARSPRVAHGTVILLVGLLGTALAWAALTQADLVVRASGRVRPLATPQKVFNSARTDVLSASTGGRVVAVSVREGDEVHEGDMLVQLDTERLDKDIARRKQALVAAEDELARVTRLEELSAAQSEEARIKAQAELAHAEEELLRAKQRQAADVRLAEVELSSAKDNEERLGRVGYGAAAPAELVAAAARVRSAKEQLEKAKLPIDDGKVKVLRQVLAVIDKEAAVKRGELALRRVAKQGEIDAARIELSALELERQHAVLRAPLGGVVTRGDVQVGDVLEAGKPVMEIAEQKGFLFEVTVPSEEVGHLQPGMAARIKLDAYDYQRYGTLSGTVASISPDSSVVEGRPTAAYLVKIAVDGDEVGRGELHGRVKLGMAGQADVVTDQESLLALLVKRIRQTISLG